MEERKDGGPAFPGYHLSDAGETYLTPEGKPLMDIAYHHGMSRRDYFAAAAMTGYLANNHVHFGMVASRGPEETGENVVADYAVMQADALLKALDE